MLAAIRGQRPDRMPWAPRLDLWFAAHQRTGTLPRRFRGMQSVRDVTDAMGVGYHAVIPEYLNVSDPDENVDRGLGIYRLSMMPFRTELRNVDRIVQEEDDARKVEYRTPVGSIWTREILTEEMKAAGASITWLDKTAITCEADYEVAGYIFENVEVTAAYENYRAFHDYVGERGIAVGYASAAAGPVQHIMRDLMPMTQFFFEMHDHPKHIERLAERMTGYYDRMLAVVADSPAEVVLFGANYDKDITYPPFFREHILPWLRKCADLLHAKGKRLLTHTDGENRGLLELYLESGIDIADSICPAPMTSLTLAETRAAFGDRITIWGGIPSVAVCDDSMSDEDFEALVRDIFERTDRGSHFILGIADTTPAPASFARLERIGEMAREWGTG